MTSNDMAFVWIWLPGEIEPVPAGKIEASNQMFYFNYGKSYLQRLMDGMPIMSIFWDLPLHEGT